MKLLELVCYFRNGGSFDEFCESEQLNQESEVIEIYIKKPLELNNDLGFFEIEKTEGKSELVNVGIEYSNLFDFYYFLNSIEDSNKEENRFFSDEEITKLLFKYALNDA